MKLEPTHVGCYGVMARFAGGGIVAVHLPRSIRREPDHFFFEAVDY
jgi:hypothetical protein